MDHVTLTVDSNGDIKFLVSPLSEGFLDSDSTVKRASHVEPWNPFIRCVFHTLRLFGDTGRVADWSRRWSIDWRVNLSPVNGPILPITFTNRATAIEFEVKWLEDNFLA
jgi:hypothetical protein